MNARQRRTWKRELSTEGGLRRKQNADRRFALREDIRMNMKDGGWSVESNWQRGWTPTHSALLTRTPVATPVPMLSFPLPMPPPGQKVVFTARFDDDSGKPIDWTNFEFDGISVREVYADGTKSENLIGSGLLAEKRLSMILPKHEKKNYPTED